MFYFPINIGNLIIPIDEVLFFRGVALAHQPEKDIIEENKQQLQAQTTPSFRIQALLDFRAQWYAEKLATSRHPATVDGSGS